MRHALGVVGAALKVVTTWAISQALGLVVTFGIGTLMSGRRPHRGDVLAVSFWTSLAFLLVLPVFLISLERLSGAPASPRALARASATCAVGGVIAMQFMVYAPSHWSIEMLLFAIQGAVAGACLPVIYKLLDRT
jgi:uncharacterized membrane protein